MDKSFTVFFIALFCLVPTYQELIAQNDKTAPDLNRFINWTVNDPVYVAKNVSHRDLGLLIAAGVSIAAVSALDRRSSSYTQSEFRNSRTLEAANELGNFDYIAPLSAALFGTSLLTDRRKFQDAAFTSFQSLLYTYLSVYTLKYVFARERPSQNSSPYAFNFFERDAASFPSGHSSNAFALVVPWVVYYPGVVTYSMLALPVGTAIARISKGEHWLSDVYAGALIGAFWGYKLSKRHLDLNRSDNLAITPFYGRNGGGVSLKVTF
ncbi:phosphatase PAP2 family protein [Rhodohalobacter sp.]|uniref:phosphatase PAP2 family protein n=1 Tax=Rhodohalobacter sp. TaxID=1974210 RepID=UPI003563364D